MPAKIDADLYSQLAHFASSRDRRAMVVKAILDGTYYGDIGLVAGSEPAVETDGNAFPMLLSAKTLVAKLSTDGGSTWGAARTHTFPTSLKSELDLGTLADGDLDTVIEAHTAGEAGDDITVAVTGDSTLRVKSFKAFAGIADGKFDSVIQAVTPGTAGDAITISLTGDGAPASGVVIAHPSANIFDITYEDNVSTVLDIEDAITALTGGDKLIEVKTPGTAITKPRTTASDFTATALAGGVNGGGVVINRTVTAFIIHYESGYSTVGHVETAITALSGGDNLFGVKSAGTGATVLTAPGDNFTATALDGGTDDGLFADIDAVVADIVADATFIGTVIEVSADDDELVLTYLTPGSAQAIKVDATSTGIQAQTADTLQYTNDQTSVGVAGISVQVRDQAEQPLEGAKDVLVRLMPVTGSPTMTIGGKGSIKLGSGTAEVWGQTDTHGVLELALVGAVASDVLVIVQTDNGEVEAHKITLPL
jgi:hypothetical protein